MTYTVLAGIGDARAPTTAGPSPGRCAFAANQTTRTFTIPIVNDTLAEGPETVLAPAVESDRARRVLGPR